MLAPLVNDIVNPSVPLLLTHQADVRCFKSFTSCVFVW